ncbi:hypothetical protein BDB13_5061 [Rhodococcus sp. OK302]|nr:hypothetical protein BDB13_5061 [Rhodococcus sp. OK302]
MTHGWSSQRFPPEALPRQKVFEINWADPH